MMEMLQEWLLGLTAAALAVSLLTAMLPKGETIRRIAGLAGGLILLLAVVQPLQMCIRDSLCTAYAATLLCSPFMRSCFCAVMLFYADEAFTQSRFYAAEPFTQAHFTQLRRCV